MNVKKIVKKFLGVTLALSFAVAIAGCGTSKASTTNSTDNKSSSTGKLEKVTFGTSPWPTNMFAYLAKEKGIFEKNGLDVDINYFTSSGDSSSAFISDKLDLCTYPSPDAIPPYSQGADFNLIMITDKSIGADGIVVKPEINSIKDLKGKTIGTQLYSVDHMYLLSLLDKEGLTENDVTISNMTIADAGTAFIAGQIDAAAIWEPYLNKAVSEGGGKLLSSSKDYPDLITDSIAASKNMVGNRPEVTTAFVKSWFEAVDYWKNNQEEAEKIMAEKLEISPAEFREMMGTLYITNVDDVVKSYTPAENDSYFGYTGQKMASFLKRLNVIEKEPNIKDMINSKFVTDYASKK